MLGRCTDRFIYSEVDGLVRRLRCLAGGRASYGRAADALGNALRSSKIADLPDETRELLGFIE
jgi:hypothetical protein